MLISFIAVVFDDMDVEDPEDLIHMLNTPPVPSHRRQETHLVSEIASIAPCTYSDEWTDVVFKDGSIVVADLVYHEMKFNWEMALGINPEQTWETKRSKDGKIKMRCYLN